MKITKKWLQKENACIDGLAWFKKQNKEFEPIPLLNLLIEKNQLDWANWLLARVMEYKQYVSYAVFAAEQVIDIFEKEFPDDKRPRTAIEAAKKCIENPSDENKKEAGSASWAARPAGCAAFSAAKSAAGSASWAARAAGWAAGWAAENAAAGWAADSSAAGSAKILKKILKYGIKLLTAGRERRKKMKIEKNEKFKSFEVIGDDGAMEVWSTWDMQRDLGLKKETPLTEEEAKKVLSKKFGDKGYVVIGCL